SFRPACVGLLLEELAAIGDRSGRLVAAAVCRGKRAEPAGQRLGSDRIGVVERSAAEGRKTQTENGSQVTVGRRPQHALVETTDGFIHKQQDEPVLNLRVGEPFAWSPALDRGIRLSMRPRYDLAKRTW